MSSNISDSKSPESGASDKLYVQVGDGWSLLASGLSTDSKGGLDTSAANLEKLASAGVLARTSNGNYQLHLRLDEENAVGVDQVTAAGTPVKALIQDTVQQVSGKAPLDNSVVNALAQSPASPIGTISSPFMNSDATAKLIFAMSDIYTTESEVRKYTDKLYANLVDQQFVQSYSQLSATNERFDAEKQRLLGALAAANMALIGAFVSAGVGLVASGASMMSARRTEMDPEVQLDSSSREKNLRAGSSDRSRDNPSASASGSKLNPQEVETHIDAMGRGNNAETSSDAARVPRGLASVEGGEVGDAAPVSATRGQEDGELRDEATTMRAGDALIAPLQAEQQSIGTKLASIERDLQGLEGRKKELQLAGDKGSEKLKEAQSNLEQFSQQGKVAREKMDRANVEMEQLKSKRDADTGREKDLISEGDRIQREIESLKTNETPQSISGKMDALDQKRSGLQTKRNEVAVEIDKGREQIAQLDRDRAPLSQKSTSLDKAVQELETKGSYLQTQISKLETALGALEAKAASLLDEKPGLSKLFGRKGGEPNATVINASSVEFSVLKSGGPRGKEIAGKLAQAHGRRGSDTTTEYGTWHASVEGFLKKHGGSTKSEQTEAISEFNSAWKKGVDLNKLSDQFAGGPVRSPKQMRAELAQAQTDLTQNGQGLAKAKSAHASAIQELASHDQHLQEVRFSQDARKERRNGLEGEIGQAEQGMATLGQQRRQLEDMQAKRNALGDQLDANKAALAKATDSANQSQSAFGAKIDEYTGLAQQNDALKRASGGPRNELESLKLAEMDRARELDQVDADLQAARSQQSTLQQQQGALDQKIEAGLRQIDAERAQASSRRVETPIVESQTPAPAPPPREAPLETVTMTPEAQSASPTPGGEEPGGAKAARSPFFKHLGQALNVLRQPEVFDLLSHLGTQAGQVITQMGRITKAQEAIAANNVLANYEKEQAYLDTTNQLLEQLISQTRDDSKQIDKEMQNLLQVIQSISASKVDMTRSLFMG